MRHSQYTLFFLAMLSSCAPSERDAAAAEGNRLLEEARREYHANRYDAARDSIMRIRQDFPLALDARHQAILLLDSLELDAARDSVRMATDEEWERLTVKVQFYERKLAEDLAKEQ